MSSGKLKVVRLFDVVAGEPTVFTLDFDADKSAVITGQGAVRFKQVVRRVSRKMPPARGGR